MSKKIVVALHGTPGLRDPVTNYLMAQTWRVWHWYADLWLLSEVPDGLTAGIIHQSLEQAIPALKQTSIMVIEMGPAPRYYGRAPRAEAWDWMSDHWGPPDIPTAIEEATQPIPGAQETKVGI